MSPETLNYWLNFKLLTVGGVSITLVGVLGAVLSVVAAIILSRVLCRGLEIFANRRGSMHPASVYTMKRILHYFLVAVGIMVGLSLLGVQLSKLALLAGALGVGIGFGLQNIVNNFVSGIIILFERTVKVGDFVEISSGLRGEVESIHIRNTVVRTPDNIEVIIPNTDLVNGQVTNWTYSDTRCRLRISFGVAYGSDKERVKQEVQRLAEANPNTLSGPGVAAPAVWMTGFGDSSLDFVLAVWITPEAVKRQTDVISSYLWAMDDAFRAADIEVPFPQRDLHLRASTHSIAIERVAPGAQPE